MFNKWFSRFKAPNKAGNSGSDQKVDGGRYAKLFELELSNMEGSPSYSLTHQLTIGSEIGNIVIADPSVSPRHATFILQQEVVSVIDHSSVAGTFVNGKKISAGKYIILEETDVIAVGDLEVRIGVKNEPFPEESDEPPSEENLPEYQPATPAGELQMEEIPSPKLTSQTPKEKPPEKKVMTFKVQSTANKGAAVDSESAGPSETRPFMANARPKKKSKFKLGFKSYHSANTLIRLMAVVADLLLAYIMVEILLPFDDFKNFIAFVPEAVFGLLEINPEVIWDIIVTDFPEVKTYWNDVSNLVTNTFQVVPILVSFILIRFATTLLFGVSISEAMLGMRAEGNGIWNRIGGILRVLLGIITGPFLIFDLPALFSKRTFKEFMTFTNTDANSTSLTTAGIVFYFPLLIALLLVSPLFQGLEVMDPIAVSMKIDKRVKVVQKEGEIAVPEVVESSDGSKEMNFSVLYPSSNASLIPSFKFTGGAKKLQYQAFVSVYLKELQRPVQIQMFKTFDLKELLSLALRGNFMLFEKYPELYAYTHEVTDKSFQKSMTAASQEAFAKEFVNYTRMALGLSVDNFIEVAQTETFIFKNLVDYKSTLLSLLEYKDFNQLGLIQIGDTYFFRANYIGTKPFDLVIPLTKGPGRIIKISFDKREKVKEVSNKFYKFVMEKSNWLNPNFPVQADKFTAFETYDFFNRLNIKDKKALNEKAKSIYGFYFEAAADILKRNDPVEYGILKKSVDDVTKIFEVISGRNPAPSDDVSVVKNFSDLKAAVEGRNMSFFGLEQSI